METLARLIPNTKLLGFRKRALLCEVVKSVFLYAAPVQVMKITKFIGMLNKIPRLALLRVASSYGTISYETLCLITGENPMEFLVG